MKSPVQRIKGAIDRSIAEEQARQKALSATKDGESSTSSRTVSRSSSTRGAASPSKRPRAKKPSTSKDANGDGAANPDPAVFEAAFAIDDTDEGTPSATPKPEEADKSLEESKDAAAPEKQAPDSGKDSSDGQANGVADKPDAAKPPPRESKSQPAASAEVTPEIRTKLKKLDKLEKTYSGLFYPSRPGAAPRTLLTGFFC